MPIRHQQQENKASGCGPACVAMVAGVTQKTAIRAMFGYDLTVSLWSTWYDVKHGLTVLGVPIAKRVRRLENWTQIRELAIVGVAKDLPVPGPMVHMVVFEPVTQLIFDPSKAAPVYRIRRPPVSCLEIYPSDTPEN